MFVDVTEFEPDGPLIFARVIDPVGAPELGISCNHLIFFEDELFPPVVEEDNLNGDEIKSCVVDILRVCAKTQNQDGQ